MWKQCPWLHSRIFPPADSTLLTRTHSVWLYRPCLPWRPCNDNHSNSKYQRLDYYSNLTSLISYVLLRPFQDASSCSKNGKTALSSSWQLTVANRFREGGPGSLISSLTVQIRGDWKYHCVQTIHLAVDMTLSTFLLEVLLASQQIDFSFGEDAVQLKSGPCHHLPWTVLRYQFSSHTNVSLNCLLIFKWLTCLWCWC